MTPNRLGLLLSRRKSRFVMAPLKRRWSSAETSFSLKMSKPSTVWYVAPGFAALPIMSALRSTAMVRREPSARHADTGTGLTRAPSISVPCGFSSSRLPIGFQLTGRAFDEATLLRAADAYQRDTKFHTEAPTIV